jgi:hypothetical protein
MSFVLLDELSNIQTFIAMGGQIAAIIICAFVLILFLLVLAVNLALAFLFAWVREKAELIKLLRPTVDSVNKSSKAALRGVAPAAEENPIIDAIAAVPGGVHTADQKVAQASERVAKAVIEFRARTVQVQTVVKAFLLPGLMSKQRTRTGEAVPELPPADEAVKERPAGRGDSTTEERQSVVAGRTSDSLAR